MQQGFDTILCHGAPPPGFTAAAKAAGLAILVDLELMVTGPDAPDSLFVALPLPTLDPRRETELSSCRHAIVTGPESAAALAQYWARRVSDEMEVDGVRLLGMQDLSASLLPHFLAAFREAAPDLILFGWTPGLPWETLAKLQPGALDYVALSLPWWDGRRDWIWRELDLLRSIGTVISDAGEQAPLAHRRLAAIVSDGWMTSDIEAAELTAMRASASARCPYSRLISTPGEPIIALQFSDQPDPRRANNTGLAIINMSAQTVAVAGANLLTRLGGDFARFTGPSGNLSPTTTLGLEPGAAVTFTATAIPIPAARPLAKVSATEAGTLPRIAIEAPSPAVDGGRFPARRTVGSVVSVECDLICDGHDRLAATVKYRGPGETAWTEVPMRLVVNDRWAADLPLDRLGLTHYTIEAWKDVWAYYVFELSAKYKAGVDTALEIKEGVALVEAAAARTKSRKLASALKGSAQGPQDRRGDARGVVASGHGRPDARRRRQAFSRRVGAPDPDPGRAYRRRFRELVRGLPALDER